MPENDKYTLPPSNESYTTKPKAVYEFEMAVRKWLEQLAHEEAQTPGPPASKRAQIREVLDELRKKYKAPSTALHKFSITGSSPPVELTPRDIYKLSHDPQAAYEVFAKASGLDHPTRNDIAHFQERLRKNFHDIATGPAIADYTPQDIQEYVTARQKERDERQQLLRGPAIARPQPVAPSVAAVEPAPYAPYKPGAEYFPGATEAELKSGIIHDLVKNYEDYVEGRAPKFVRPAGNLGSAAPGADLMEKEGLLARKAREPRDAYLKHLEAEKKYREDLKKHEDYILAQQERPRLAQLAQEDLRNAPQEIYKSLLGRAELPQVEHKLYEPYENIPSLNAYHHQAMRLGQQNIGSQDEAYKNIQNRLNNLSNRPEIPDIVQPYLDTATTHPAMFMARYKNAYEADVIKKMEEQAKENFLEKILPSINARYGARSGLRESLLRTHALKMDKELQRNIADLRSRNFEHALKAAESHQGMNLKGAEIAGNAERQHVADVMASQKALQDQMAAQKGHAQADVQASLNAATIMDQQAERMIAERTRQEALPRARQMEGANMLIAGMGAMPAPPGITYNLATKSPGASPYGLGIGAGTAMQMANVQRGIPQMGPNPIGFPAQKAGGHMKFAQGGMPQHENIIQDYADRLANPSFDPYGAWMSHMTPALFQASGAPEMAQASRDYNAAQEAHKERQQRGLHDAGALHNMILNSKLQQRKILEDYKMHRETLGENARHHQMMEGFEGQKVAHSTRPKIVRIGDKEYILPPQSDTERAHEISRQQALQKEEGDIAARESKSLTTRVFGNSANDKRLKEIKAIQKLTGQHNMTTDLATSAVMHWLENGEDKPLEYYADMVLSGRTSHPREEKASHDDEGYTPQLKTKTLTRAQKEAQLAAYNRQLGK